ncbi:MAG: peptidoglycan DD-metalloendopeptidase family protein [Candidatus Zixiibacteriota bacterium]
MIRKLIVVQVFIISIFLISSVNAQPVIWGPEVFERNTGVPQEVSKSLEVPNAEWEYDLVIKIGGEISSRVSSGIIKINNQIVVGREEFNQTVTEINKPITLQKENTISVLLEGVPGSALEISIFGPSIEDEITPDGGIVILENIAEVEFLSGTFSNSIQVNLYVDRVDEEDETFSIPSILYDIDSYLPYEIVINTGLIMPDIDVSINISVPNEFKQTIQQGYTLAGFIQLYQDGGLAPIDCFQRFVSDFNSTNNILSVIIPRTLFTNVRRSDGNYETILLCATVPDIQIPIFLNQEYDCPLPFGPPLDLSQLENKTLEISQGGEFCPDKEECSRYHLGVDYRTDGIEGISVIAPADGKVDYVSETEAPGFGYWMAVRHELPSGSFVKTVYGHLQSKPNLKKGDTVIRGKEVAKSGNTDGKTGTSDGPHLHFEILEPGCESLEKGVCSRIDPTHCVGYPKLLVAPMNISWEYLKGIGDLPSTEISIANIGSGTLNWSASCAAEWINLSQTSGQGNFASIIASLSDVDITAGEHNAEIVISDINTPNSEIIVNVELTVSANYITDIWSEAFIYDNQITGATKYGFIAVVNNPTAIPEGTECKFYVDGVFVGNGSLYHQFPFRLYPEYMVPNIWPEGSITVKADLENNGNTISTFTKTFKTTYNWIYAASSVWEVNTTLEFSYDYLFIEHFSNDEIVRWAGIRELSNSSGNLLAAGPVWPSWLSTSFQSYLLEDRTIDIWNTDTYSWDVSSEQKEVSRIFVGVDTTGKKISFSLGICYLEIPFCRSVASIAESNFSDIDYCTIRDSTVEGQITADLEFYKYDIHNFPIFTCARTVDKKYELPGQIATIQIFINAVHMGVYKALPHIENPDEVAAVKNYNLSLSEESKTDNIAVINEEDAFKISNYPNPFNPTTTLNYSIPRQVHVSIDIFNIIGQKVITLVDENKPAGEYQVEWNGTNSKGNNISTGIYLYRFKAGNYLETKKMLLLK